MIIGTKISNFLKIPSIKLEADNKRCIDCMSCTKNCPMSLEVNEMARKNNMKNSERIFCGSCIDVCPKSVIIYRFK